MDLSFYRGKRVLITGHTGFKGTWMSTVLCGAGAEVIGYSCEQAEDRSFFKLSGMEKKLRHVTGDVRDLEHMKTVFAETQPEIVIHMAAQPIVRDSYRNPVYTYETNVMGTVHILECVRLNPCVKSVVNITTDKVYENKEWVWGYRENEKLDGYDPYSNSKSCSELVTHSYCSSFFTGRDLAVSTARAGNVIGGGDFANDRIIPDCVRAMERGTPIIVRNPHSVRPYQHVLDPVLAYLLIASRQYEDQAKAGWYNVGPNDVDHITTSDLVSMFCKAWGEDARWECCKEQNAPHEAGYLKLDCSHIKQALGWKPRWGIADAVRKTVEWSRVYLEGGDIPKVMDKQISDFLKG